MIIETVKNYNERMLRKWHEDVDKWKQDKITNNIIPQIAFYLFWNNRGYERQIGYIASDKHSSYWAKTKQEALNKLTKKL